MADERPGHSAKESDLIARMIHLACAEQHGTPKGTLCADCASLLAYAQERIARCPYGEAKPTCRRCPIHCYRPAERARIKEVMRFAGPRLLSHGDLGALQHLLHGLKPVPEHPKRKR